MKHKRYFVLPVLLMFICLQMACLKKPEEGPAQSQDSRSLLTILKNNYSFSMLYSALQRTGLDKTLEGKGPFTVFAPDNDAFSRSGITTDSLAKMDVAVLKKLLSYHVAPVAISHSTVPQAIDFKYPTLAGVSVYFSVPIPGPNQYGDLTALRINGGLVNSADVTAGNGNIIVLNKVLSYPATSIKAFLEQDNHYSLFVQALKQFGLFDQLDKAGPFVVMAPNNDAFASYGLDKISLAQIDTIQYKKFLFSCYVLPQQRFFISDLSDAPLDLSAPPGIVTKDFIETPGGYSTPANYGLKSLDYFNIENYQAAPYYGNSYVFAPPANIISPDNNVENGIVHGIDALVMPPDSARVRK